MGGGRRGGHIVVPFAKDRPPEGRLGELLSTSSHPLGVYCDAFLVIFGLPSAKTKLERFREEEALLVVLKSLLYL